MSSYLWPSEDGWPYPDQEGEQIDFSNEVDDDIVSLRASPAHLFDTLDPLERFEDAIFVRHLDTHVDAMIIPSGSRLQRPDPVIPPDALRRRDRAGADHLVQRHAQVQQLGHRVGHVDGDRRLDAAGGAFHAARGHRRAGKCLASLAQPKAAAA